MPNHGERSSHCFPESINTSGIPAVIRAKTAGWRVPEGSFLGPLTEVRSAVRGRGPAVGGGAGDSLCPTFPSAADPREDSC